MNENNGRSSVFQTAFHTLNILSGVGVLSMPYTLASGGWLSLIFLIAIAVITFYTSLLIRKCMLYDINLKTYPDIGERAFGRIGKIVTSIFIHLELFLVATGFLILEGDNLKNLFPNFRIHIISLKLDVDGTQTFTLIVSLVIMLSLIPESLDFLAYVSLSGVLASGIIIGSVVVIGSSEAMFNQKGDLINWSGIPRAFSLYAFCYGVHVMLPTLYTSMQKKHQFSNVMLACFILATLGYVLIAVVGYLMFGSNAQSQITLNLPVDKLGSKVAIYTTLVNPIAKYPLMIAPIVNTIRDFLPSHHSEKKYVRISISLILVISSVAIALALPFFGYLMSLVGAFSNVTVSILLPCLCYLKISGTYNKCSVETVILYSVVLVGVPVGVIGTYISVRDIINQL